MEGSWLAHGAMQSLVQTQCHSLEIAASWNLRAGGGGDVQGFTDEEATAWGGGQLTQGPSASSRPTAQNGKVWIKGRDNRT